MLPKEMSKERKGKEKGKEGDMKETKESRAAKALMEETKESRAAKALMAKSNNDGKNASESPRRRRRRRDADESFVAEYDLARRWNPLYPTQAEEDDDEEGCDNRGGGIVIDTHDVDAAHIADHKRITSGAAAVGGGSGGVSSAGSIRGRLVLATDRVGTSTVKSGGGGGGGVGGGGQSSLTLPFDGGNGGGNGGSGGGGGGDDGILTTSAASLALDAVARGVADHRVRVGGSGVGDGGDAPGKVIAHAERIRLYDIAVRNAVPEARRAVFYD
jgi:hypothetical protein